MRPLREFPKPMAMGMQDYASAMKVVWNRAAGTRQTQLSSHRSLGSASAALCVFGGDIARLKRQATLALCRTGGERDQRGAGGSDRYLGLRGWVCEGFQDRLSSTPEPEHSG